MFTKDPLVQADVFYSIAAAAVTFDFSRNLLSSYHRGLS